MKKFLDVLKRNSKLVILFLVFLVLLSFTIYNKFIKKEEKKDNNIENVVNFKSYDNEEQLKFLPYRIIIDEEHKKTMLVYAKSETDYSSDYKYYILVNNEKKELKQFQNDEHVLVLESDILVKDKFKVIIESNKDKKDIKEIEQELKDVIKYDLNKVTKEKFEEHEKLSHHIESNKGAIKIAEKNLKEQEDLLKFTNEKIDEYNKLGKSSSVKTYEKAKEEVEKEILKNKKEKEDKEKELNKLMNDNKDLEEMFDYLFGGLHKH